MFRESIMKKVVITSLLLSIVGLSSIHVSHADTHSLSMGYTQSRVEHFNNIRGINLKYRYESEMPVGLITSFSYLAGKNGYNEFFSREASLRGDLKFNYWSLMAGPAYRINDYVSFYALAGAGTGKGEMKQHMTMAGFSEYSETSKRKTGFSWGSGLQFNPANNFVIDIGYEGSKIDDAKLNGFNIGVGYLFQ